MRRFRCENDAPARRLPVGLEKSWSVRVDAIDARRGQPGSIAPAKYDASALCLLQQPVRTVERWIVQNKLEQMTKQDAHQRARLDRGTAAQVVSVDRQVLNREWCGKRHREHSAIQSRQAGQLPPIR